MRKFLIALLLLLGLVFLFSRLGEAQEVLMTLRMGDWRWLGVALVVHVLYVVNIGASFRTIYRTLGLEEQIARLTLLGLAANFVIVVAPSAGMGGVAVFAADAQARGHPTGRVTTAGVMYLLYDYLATLIASVLGLFVLFQHHEINGGEITAALILALMALGLGSLLYLGMRSGDMLGRALRWLSGVLNRLLRPFLRRDRFDASRAYAFGLEAAEGLRTARESPRGLLWPFALALSNKALMMTILFLMFLAFGQPFTIGTLVAGYSIGYLFTIVSPTPSGIGFVETAMTLVLRSLGVPLAPAALIVLGFRGFTVWLSLAYGMIAIRWVGKAPSSSREGRGEGRDRLSGDPVVTSKPRRVTPPS
jgi:uncharacterized protein (TIRG00374 family)